MVKILYTSLVAVFAGALMLFGARAGLFSPANHSGLTADFKLVSEIPISSPIPSSTKTTKKEPVVNAGYKAAPVAKTTPRAPIIASSPVFSPVPPTKVVLPAPTPSPVVTPEPETIQIPQPDPVTQTIPEAISIPESLSTTTPETTPEPIRVEIYAIQTGTTLGGVSDEFVKLYNPTNSEIDLAGWALKKTNSNGNYDNLVSSAAFVGKIASHGYFLIAHSGYKGPDSVNLTYSANSNNLSYANNAVILYATNGSVMDNVSWTEIPKDTIWKRE